MSPPQSFSGRMCVKVYCRKSTTLVNLHSKSRFGIKIMDSVKVNSLSLMKTQPMEVKSKVHDEGNGILTIELNKTMKEGNTYQLCLNYEGTFNGTLGYMLYQIGNMYILLANSKKQTTFPCFDEPNMRATFHITYNTTGEVSIQSNGKFLSYLSNLDHHKPKSVTYQLQNDFPASQIPFVLANMNLTQIIHNYLKEWKAVFKGSVHYMGQEVTEFRPFMENETKDMMKGLPLKIQIIVLPTKEDLVSKWKLTSIRLDEITEPVLYKKRYNIYIRFTRMIFGGLISPYKSEFDWMYKAFAEFLAVLPIQGANPKYMWDRVSDDLDKNMVAGIDKLQNDIHAMEKGYLLLKMVYYHLGYKQFMKKIKSLISQFSYKSESPQQLFGAFGSLEVLHEEALEDMDLTQVVGLYMTQSSYPLVKLTPLPKTGDGFYNVTQKQFTNKFKPTEEQGDEDDEPCWIFPISYAIFDIQNKEKVYENWQLWLDCAHRLNIYLPYNSKTQDVIFLNYKCAGVYRVQYEHEQWTRIVKFLHNHRIAVHRSTRACVVHDALSLAWMGDYDYSYVFRLLTFLKEEDDLTVWKAFFLGASDLNEILLFSEETYPLFQGFVNEIINATFTKKYPSSTHFFDILDTNPGFQLTNADALFYKWACTIARNEYCRTQAIEKFATWTPGIILSDKGDPTDKQIMFYTVLCTVLSEESMNESEYTTIFTFLQSFHHGSGNENYRGINFNVLRCLKNEEKIKSWIDWCKTPFTGDEDKLLKEQSFLNLAAGRHSFLPSLEYLKDRVSNHMEDQTRNGTIFNDVVFLADIVRVLFPRMNPTQLKEMDDLINSTPAIKNKLAVLLVNEDAKNAQKLRTQWLNANDNNIRNLLRSRLEQMQG